MAVGRDMATAGRLEKSRPGLGVISLTHGGDGIAYVARLVHRTLTDLALEPPLLVELAPAVVGAVTIPERSRFLGRLIQENLRANVAWWIFNHVGIAQAQRWVPRRIRRPYGIFLAGIEAWDPALTEARKRVIRDARVRIAISHYTARRVTDVFPELGTIVPCPLALLPVTSPPMAEVDREMLTRIRPRSVVIVGRMSASERYKGHDELIGCWSRVRDAVPDAQLVVVGRGDDADRLRRTAAESGLGDDILFTGFVSDATLYYLLRRVTLFAMPSRGEGFGLVYLQAMEAGLPCIGSTADAASDLIVHDETGFLVRPDDPYALSRSLIALLQESELRARMGTAGERRYRAEFTYEHFRARFASVLISAFEPLASERTH